MKKIVGFALVILVLLAIYVLIEKMVLSSGQSAKNELNQDIDEKKFYKEIGKSFEINGLKATVHSFDVQESQGDSATLNIKMSLEAINAADVQLQSEFFVLNDESNREFLPKNRNNITIGKGVQEVILIYHVPERSLPYFSYRLYLYPTDKTNDKVIINIYKNYRANG